MIVYSLQSGPHRGRNAVIAQDADGDETSVRGLVCWYVLDLDLGYWGERSDGVPVTDT